MALTGKRIDREDDLPAQVAGKVVAEVMAGRLKPGDRLPTEPEMADLYGVSRTVIREAMVRLKSDGVARSKQGSGVFILDSSQSPVLRLDHASLMDRETVRNLFELRAIIESGAAWLAAERRDPAALGEIDAALQELRSLSGSEPASVDSDLAFHQAVARATGNPMIATFIRFVAAQVRQAIVETRIKRHREGLPLGSTEEHATIFKAIQAGDPAAARDAMVAHLTNGARRTGIVDFRFYPQPKASGLDPSSQDPSSNPPRA